MDQPAEHQAEGTARGGDGKYTRSIETAQRDAQAARYRARGWSYQRIADEMSISRTAAHEAVQRALRETVEEPAADVRALEIARLDEMYERVLEVLERQHVTVSNGRVIYVGDQPLEDDGPVLAAVDRLLKIQARRAALLGLDMPTKVEQSGRLTYEIVGVDMEAL